MKVLWISHFLPYPPKGGLLQRGYYLLRELARYADVDLMALNQPRLIGPLMPEISDPRSHAVQQLSQFCRVLSVEDVPLSQSRWGSGFIAVRSLASRYPYNVNWLVSSTFEAKLDDVLRATPYDVVHFDTIGLAYYAATARRVSPASARSLGHHNIESHMLLRRAKTAGTSARSLYYLQEGRRLATYEREQCPQFSLNVVCSELDGARLADMVAVPRIETIENGVDVEYFRPVDAPRRGKRLVFIGTMNWYPNVDAMRFFLGEVWPLLVKVDPDVSMDIIGANPPDDLIQAAAKDPRVRVHGFVSDIRSYLDEAAAYVCPIRDGGGTKLKVLDAFASGVPMVAHPVACEGIDVQDGKHVLFATEPKEFASKILQLLNDQNTGLLLSEHARRLVEERYSFTSIGKRLHRTFESLMTKNSRQAACAG